MAIIYQVTTQGNQKECYSLAILYIIIKFACLPLVITEQPQFQFILTLEFIHVALALRLKQALASPVQYLRQRMNYFIRNQEKKVRMSSSEVFLSLMGTGRIVFDEIEAQALPIYGHSLLLERVLDFLLFSLNISALSAFFNKFKYIYRLVLHINRTHSFCLIFHSGNYSQQEYFVSFIYLIVLLKNDIRYITNQQNSIIKLSFCLLLLCQE